MLQEHIHDVIADLARIAHTDFSFQLGAAHASISIHVNLAQAFPDLVLQECEGSSSNLLQIRYGIRNHLR